MLHALFPQVETDSLIATLDNVPQSECPFLVGGHQRQLNTQRCSERNVVNTQRWKTVHKSGKVCVFIDNGHRFHLT